LQKLVNHSGLRCDSEGVSPILRSAEPGEFGSDATDVAIGRDEAVPLLFRAHGASLVRLGYVLTSDRGIAEEAVQDAFVSLHRNWHTLRDRAATLPYLRAVVVNRCRSAHRRRARTVRATEPLTPEVAWLPGADTQAVAHDEALRIAAGVQRLPTRQREVVVCRYYLDLTERQTADLLEISVGSVKKHASRALARLHDELEVSL
jgi:RNA polymerase sigma-70 factor (sigma-E family)